MSGYINFVCGRILVIPKLGFNFSHPPGLSIWSQTRHVLDPVLCHKMRRLLPCSIFAEATRVKVVNNRFTLGALGVDTSVKVVSNPAYSAAQGWYVRTKSL